MTHFAALASIGQCATLACIWEATAPKPGNVHRGADFDDLTYLDLVTSAIAIGPSMDAASRGLRLGETVLQAIQATRASVCTNTNLGSVLLLAPLAMVPTNRRLDAAAIEPVLAGLDQEDARLVYEAIRLAQPGGLGRVESADVSGPAPADLRAAMLLAAPRDLVARQYANDFREIFAEVVPSLADGMARGWCLSVVIVQTQLHLLSRHGDSLIARKCGEAVSAEVAGRAAGVLESGLPCDDAYRRSLVDFDSWLRADGHRRNPGTTADLIAAGLFVALRDAIIKPPLRFYA